MGLGYQEAQEALGGLGLLLLLGLLALEDQLNQVGPSHQVGLSILKFLVDLVDQGYQLVQMAQCCLLVQGCLGPQFHLMLQ